MSIGVILLIIMGILIYFEAAQRVLDRLYLSDNIALLIVVAIIVGSFFNIPLSRDPFIDINVGGALIPIILVIYVLSRTGSTREWMRALLASIATGAVIYLTTIVFQNFGEGRDIIDPMYIFAVAGGIFGYLFGRSRRGAFIAGTLGFLFYNLINVWEVVSGQIVTQIRLGGAGIFDSIVISGFLAVLLAELIGESRERLQGGHISEEEHNGNRGSDDYE